MENPFTRGQKLVRDAADSEAAWTEDDCKDVFALFYQNKKRNKDLTLNPQLPGRGSQNLFLKGQHQTRLQYYRDPVTKDKVTLPHLKRLYQEKCGLDKTEPVAPANNTSGKGGSKAPLTPLDERVLKELSERKQDAEVQEKTRREAEAQKEAESGLAFAGVGLAVAALAIGYVLYLKYGK
jgi:hypothetical protein